MPAFGFYCGLYCGLSDRTSFGFVTLTVDEALSFGFWQTLHAVSSLSDSVSSIGFFSSHSERVFIRFATLAVDEAPSLCLRQTFDVVVLWGFLGGPFVFFGRLVFS